MSSRYNQSMRITDVVPAEERRFGYLSETDAIEFEETAEGIARSWIHAAPIGTYKHPLYGKINFTAERVQAFAQNVMDRVRGIDLAIDYSHKSGDKAAGWVRQAEARPDGLWLLVEWTKAAADAIRNKEYRYFSPEFVDEYQDAKSGDKFKNVLLGGGLTNRPFLKDLLPVNLSEVFAEVDGDTVNSTGFTLSGNGSEFSSSTFYKVEETKEEEPVSVPDNTSGVSMEEFENLQKQLDEAKTLIAKQAAAQRLSEVNHQLRDWQRGGDGQKFAIPPAVTDQLREVLVGSSMELSEKLIGVFTELLKTGLVTLEEKGTTRTDAKTDEVEEITESDATARFNELVNAILEENPSMNVGDAIEEAARRDETLFAEYRDSTYTFREDD